MPRRMTSSSRLSSISRRAAGLTTAIAAVVIAGRMFNIPLMSGLGLPWSRMSMISALCFLMSGVALMLRGQENDRVASGTASALALVVGVLAALGIIENIPVVNNGIYLLLNRTLGVLGPTATSPGARTFSPTTPVPFLLVGMGLLRLGWPRRSAFDAVSWLGLAAASFALHVLLSYGLVLSPENAVQMAPVSAVALLLLGVAMTITRVDPSFFRIFRPDNAIGYIAKRMLLAGLLAPPLLFVFQALWLVRRGSDVQYQSVFFAALYAMAFLGLIIVALRRMDLLDQYRNAAELARNELLSRVQQQAASLQFEVSQRTFELQESSKRLELALRSASCGVWDWDLATGRAIWNEQQCTIYGLAPGQFDGRLETWASMLHPDDRPQAEASMHRELKADEHFDNAFRIVRPDGAVRYIESHGFANRDSSGKCIRLVGVDRDVTDMRESERALVSLAQRLQFALGSAGYGVWETDCRTGRLTWDDRMLAIYGMRSEDFRGTQDDRYRAVVPD